ncbi:MAG: aminopeptidase P family protein [Spirochaetales bacterium]|nr:aminopeptidase P family protein [Spirochaetales bacterium]
MPAPEPLGPGAGAGTRYQARQRRLCDYLAENDIEAAVLVDLEGNRNRSLRYLCGHPQDALLFLFADGETLLLPWDVPLAECHAVVGSIRAFEEYGRREETAIRSVLADAAIKTAELPGTLAFPLVQSLKASLSGTALHCRSDGLDRLLRGWRAVKDEEELASLRRACALTNELLGEVESLLLDAGHAEASGVAEQELALRLESGALRRGAEGMGFETLAAGPGRSFAIHCFPAVTSGPFGAQGLSILDFGVVVEGYTSDVTLTAARGPLSGRQEEMINAVRGAYELAVALCAPGVELVSVARAVDEYLQGRGFRMPHALGHGIGLDAHEEPVLRSREAAGGSGTLKPGMVFTLEPGVYEPGEGGVRLENDFLCTAAGVEALTSARFVRT